MLFIIFPLSLLIFYLSLIFVSLIYCVSWVVFPWVSFAWDSLCFLDLVDYFLFHVREVFSYYFFKYFLKSFLSPPPTAKSLQSCPTLCDPIDGSPLLNLLDQIEV